MLMKMFVFVVAVSIERARHWLPSDDDDYEEENRRGISSEANETFFFIQSITRTNRCRGMDFFTCVGNDDEIITTQSIDVVVPMGSNLGIGCSRMPSRSIKANNNQNFLFHTQ